MARNCQAAFLTSCLARVLLIGWLPLATGGATKSDAARELIRWAQGPVRWLLLPNEWKELRQVEDTAAALSFVEGFWFRRDPQPAEPGNAFRGAFSQRVVESDLLYVEGGVKGSLTDRGRSLILLGAPSHVRVASEPILAWDAQRKTRRGVTTRTVDVEIWAYRLDELSPRLIELAHEWSRESERALPLTLTFRSDSRRTYLVEGKVLLDLAARAACLGCQ